MELSQSAKQNIAAASLVGSTIVTIAGLVAGWEDTVGVHPADSGSSACYEAAAPIALNRVDPPEQPEQPFECARIEDGDNPTELLVDGAWVIGGLVVMGLAEYARRQTDRKTVAFIYIGPGVGVRRAVAIDERDTSGVPDITSVGQQPERPYTTVSFMRSRR